MARFECGPDKQTSFSSSSMVRYHLELILDYFFNRLKERHRRFIPRCATKQHHPLMFSRQVNQLLRSTTRKKNKLAANDKWSALWNDLTH